MTFLSGLVRSMAASMRPGATSLRKQTARSTTVARPVLEELEPRLVFSVPTPDHVVIVIEENHGFSQIIGSSAAPYINSLAQSGALFTNSYAITHPSEPNYLALFSGSTQGVTDDGHYDFTGPNLARSLLNRGLTFGGYSEDLPYVGFTGDTAGAYARKHNPWVSFTNVPASVNMPYSSFPTDYNQLPTVSIVVPNLNDDMHDGTIQQGDTWLQANIDAYAQWARTHNSLLIVTWDEDDSSGANQIPTLFVGAMVHPGNYGEPINHYNVLRTVEDMYGLPYIASDGGVPPISDVWTGFPTFADPGFEMPSVGTGPGAYRYAPMGSPWMFTGTAGVAGNGSSFGNPDAPQGTQVAFLQEFGSISQSVNFPGTVCSISFAAAQRSSNPTWQTLEVLVDGNLVSDFTPVGSSFAAYNSGPFQVTAGVHTISFVGTDPDGRDNTAFVDQVQINHVIASDGFEVPSVGSGVQYDPTTSPHLTFSGTAGIAGDGSSLTSGNPPAPQGTQVAFLQGSGSFTASGGVPAGTYTITFMAAQAAGNLNNETVQVLVDGVVVGTFTPISTGYTAFTTSSFTLAAGPHTLTFAGHGPDSTDTVLIDEVQLLA
jgi:hypothetical protein